MGVNPDVGGRFVLPRPNPCHTTEDNTMDTPYAFFPRTAIPPRTTS
ncbi:hypothetical protein LZ755_05665 [Xylella fastidiosa subsp. morus]|nr:hypothetical protein [Xylella fastidiosa]UIT39980.1 hypothetical protein LZ755_05665 [Xylella fastidiosa subsp. morus]